MKLVRALAAAAVLAALLIGVPALLLSWGRLDALASVDWARALTRPDDGRVLLGLLTAVGWLAWVLVAITTALEVVAALTRRRVAPRLPGTGWLRPGIATLIAAATMTPAFAAAAPPTPPPAASAPDPGPVLQAAEQAEKAPRGRGYLVRAGDELWDIAERELGSGERWREIVALTPGLTAQSRLAPGQLVSLPDTGAPSPSPSVTVVAGDTLWALAEQHLGDPERWPEIYELNRATIDDPDEIEIGWELRLPEAEGPPPPTQADLAGTDENDPDEVGPAPATPEQVGPPISEHLVAELVEHVRIEEPRDDDAPDLAELDAVVATPDEEAASDDGVAALLGSMGAALAASVAVGLAGRRRVQALARAMGRRIAPLDPDLGRFWTALARRAEGSAEADAEPRPTAWVAGWDEDGHEARHCLEPEGVTLVAGEPEQVQGLIGAAITSLLCAPWSEEVSLVVADAPDDWAAALDDPGVVASPTSEALARLTRVVAERRIALGERALDEVRGDPALASSWVPLVFVFARPLAPHEERALGQALGLGRVGVSALASVARAGDARTIRVGERTLRLPGRPEALEPQLISAPARRALIELFAATGATGSEPAPWWRDEPAVHVLSTPPAEVDPMPEPPAPTVLLLGDVALQHAAGEPPSRAHMQCIEYCAWLLTHPGSTSLQMQHGLLVAEGTRRSNMSRLRSWLGSDPEGKPYLPDAYSGRIELHPAVSSDWERFDALVGAGVNLASNAVLAEALTLVRGEPLATVAFQWPWAEDLRAEMEGTIVDAACVLFDRCLATDAEAAGWALRQGRLAAPRDENLASREVQYWARLGNRRRADEAVLALTRAARASGQDLQHDTVARIQHALHTMASVPRRLAQ